MATALTAVPAPTAPGSIPQALVEHLISARVKIAALADAFDRDRAQRLLRAQQELVDQVAPVLAAMADTIDLKLVDQIATRSVPVMDLAERDQRNRDRLALVQHMIRQRIDGLKVSDPTLLVKALQRQRAGLEAELALHEGHEEELAQAIECIADELARLTGKPQVAQVATTKRSARKAPAR